MFLRRSIRIRVLASERPYPVCANSEIKKPPHLADWELSDSAHKSGELRARDIKEKY